MIPSLSSLPTKAFRYVVPGQGDFTANPELALESYLESFGFPQAGEFIKQLLLYKEGSFIALLNLLSLLDAPGITQVCALLKLQLGEPYDSVKSYLQAALPVVSSVDYSETLDKVSTGDYQQVIQEYFGYQAFDEAGLLDADYLLGWVKTAEPSLQQEVSCLEKEDLLGFLVACIDRLCLTNLTLSAQAYFKLSSLLVKVLAPGVLGTSINQELYLNYVAALKTPS